MDSTDENEASSADTDAGDSVWQLNDDLDYDCNCPGPPPPPVFKIPPPPRPPFMREIDCSDFNTQNFDSCDLMTVIDAGYHGNPTIPTLTVVGICSALLLAGAFIVFAFAWKNKKKVQNFLPCKSSPHQNRCESGHGNGVIYEDLAPVRPRTAVNPNSFEMLDVKTARGNSYVIGARPPMFICSPIVRQEHEYGPPPRQDCRRHCSQDLYNPVYEELSNGSGEKCDSDGESECTRVARESEDEFAEDELSLGDHCHLHHQHQSHSGTSSLQGSTGNDLCRDVDSSDADDRSRFLCHGAAPCLRTSRNNNNSICCSGSSRGGVGTRNLSLPANRRIAGGKHHYYDDNTNNVERTNVTVNQTRSQQRRPRSLDRKHHHHHHHRNNVVRQPNSGSSDYVNEFHEGLLLDAYYQLYPSAPADNYDDNRITGQPSQLDHQARSVNIPYILPVVNRPTIPVVVRNNNNNNNNRLVDPYESVPVLEQIRNNRDETNNNQTNVPLAYHHSHHCNNRDSQQHHHHPKCQHSVVVIDDRNNDLTSFRSPVGKPTSQDSDSGYSNNTSGGRGSSSSRSRNDNLPPHVLASPSDYAL